MWQIGRLSLAVVVLFTRPDCMANAVLASEPPFQMRLWAPDHADLSPLGDYFDVHGLRSEGAAGKTCVTGITVSANRDIPGAPLPTAGSDRYLSITPPVYSGDFVPMFGQLYRVGHLREPDHSGRDRFFDIDRVPFEEYPPSLSVFPPALTGYVFPLNDDADTRRRHSGTLNGDYIFLEEIEGTDAKLGQPRAKVGTLRKTTDSDAPPIDHWKEITWNWFRVGDDVKIGEKERKLLRIVPPISAKDLDRDGARMVGWIELDSKPSK